MLRDVVVWDGEGWLFEESAEDLTRMEKMRVWVVDPLDGMRELVAGIPKFYLRDMAARLDLVIETI